MFTYKISSVHTVYFSLSNFCRVIDSLLVPHLHQGGSLNWKLPMLPTAHPGVRRSPSPAVRYWLAKENFMLDPISLCSRVTGYICILCACVHVYVK